MKNYNSWHLHKPWKWESHFLDFPLTHKLIYIHLFSSCRVCLPGPAELSWSPPNKPTPGWKRALQGRWGSKQNSKRTRGFKKQVSGRKHGEDFYSRIVWKVKVIGYSQLLEQLEGDNTILAKEWWGSVGERELEDWTANQRPWDQKIQILKDLRCEGAFLLSSALFWFFLQVLIYMSKHSPC